MSASAVGMGLLTQLTYRDAAGRDHKISPRSRWLAWSPTKRQLLICRKGNGATAALSAGVRRIHNQFHDGPSRKALPAVWPDPRGRLTVLGCLVDLTYKVPRSVISPEKNPYRWHHLFGDHGESGHGEGRSTKQYPERYMPHLCRDSAGNLYIKRRPGNRYYVAKWLMW